VQKKMKNQAINFRGNNSYGVKRLLNFENALSPPMSSWIIELWDLSGESSLKIWGGGNSEPLLDLPF
jgi:hypothetical protein